MTRTGRNDIKGCKLTIRFIAYLVIDLFTQCRGS